MPPTRNNAAAAKNWVMTAYAPQADSRTNYAVAIMRYFIVGDETCPDTARAHWQCYVQFHKKLRINQVKQIFGTPCTLKACVVPPKRLLTAARKKVLSLSSATSPLGKATILISSMLHRRQQP